MLLILEPWDIDWEILIASDDRKGLLFENLFVTQMIHSIAAKDVQGARLSNFRTQSGSEVDIVFETPHETVAIEIKATDRVDESDARGLKSFEKYFDKPHRSMIAYLGEHRLSIGKVEVLPWQQGLKELNL